MNWNDESEDYNRAWQLEKERKKILAEIATYLSPGNQNVLDGDLLASLRDLQQIRVTSQGLAEAAHKAIEELAGILLPVEAGQTYSWRTIIDAVKKLKGVK